MRLKGEKSNLSSRKVSHKYAILHYAARKNILLDIQVTPWGSDDTHLRKNEPARIRGGNK
jgi:hypothetical protein